MTPTGHVDITCEDPPVGTLTLLLGEEPVVLSGGFGGWEVVGRPRQVGMTLWDGVDPYQLQLPLMLDGYAAGQSVERVLRQLSRIARGDRDSEPGVIEVEGVPLPTDQWVIEDMQLGEPIRAVADMALLRQPLTLVLREHVPPSFLRLHRRALTRPRRPTKTVPVKKGDTPAKLARRHHVKWTAIRELNPKVVKKANQKLKAGTRLRVPVARPKRKKGGKGGGDR